MSNLDTVKGQTQTIHDAIASVSAAVDAAEQSLADALDAKDAQIAAGVSLETNLQAKLDDASATITALTAKAADLTSQLAASQSSITDLNAIIASMTSQHTADQVAIAGLNSQVADLNAQIVTLKAQVADLQAKLAATPAPVVPSSIPTAGFSVVLQNMTEIQSGVFRSTNLGAAKASGGQVAVVQARLHTAAKPGQTVVNEYDQVTNVVFDGTKNIKDWRAFTNPSSPYPNVWTGRGPGDGASKLTAENPDGALLQHSSHPAGWTNAYFGMPLKSDVKQHIKRTLRISSLTGKPDGYAKIEVDGAVVFESQGFIVDGPLEDFGAQMVWESGGTSGPLPAGSYLQIENISVVVS